MLKKGLYTLCANKHINTKDVKNRLYELIHDTNFYFKECEIVNEFTYISFIACDDIDNIDLDDIILDLSEAFNASVELEWCMKR